MSCMARIVWLFCSSFSSRRRRRKRASVFIRAAPATCFCSSGLRFCPLAALPSAIFSLGSLVAAIACADCATCAFLAASACCGVCGVPGAAPGTAVEPGMIASPNALDLALFNSACVAPARRAASACLALPDLAYFASSSFLDPPWLFGV